MEPTRLNANRFAQLSGGLMSLESRSGLLRSTDIMLSLQCGADLD
jgi:hypothetical protein